MYVIYHVSSTMQVGPTKHGRAHSLYAKPYKARGTALRIMRKFNEYEVGADFIGPGPYGVADVDHYRNHVVRMVVKKTIFGNEFTEASNTPSYLSPASEAYWSR